MVSNSHPACWGGGEGSLESGMGESTLSFPGSVDHTLEDIVFWVTSEGMLYTNNDRDFCPVRNECSSDQNPIPTPSTLLLGRG